MSKIKHWDFFVSFLVLFIFALLIFISWYVSLRGECLNGSAKHYPSPEIIEEAHQMVREKLIKQLQIKAVRWKVQAETDIAARRLAEITWKEERLWEELRLLENASNHNAWRTTICRRIQINSKVFAINFLQHTCLCWKKLLFLSCT